MRPIYNGEQLYHHGVLGMKWGHHKAKVAAKKDEIQKRDNDIINARNKIKSTMEDYQKKSDYANKNPHDKKSIRKANEAYIKAMSAQVIAKQKTHKELNRSKTIKTIKTLAVIGILGINTGVAVMREIK